MQHGNQRSPEKSKENLKDHEISCQNHVSNVKKGKNSTQQKLTEDYSVTIANHKGYKLSKNLISRRDVFFRISETRGSCEAKRIIYRRDW